ncbi:MAG: hypothetical protein HYZ51_03895 [Candidatus Doudnabacteria bacterium]|nr:hypothetical protein [Candidatus Doudnabacteria bacterium]
MQRDYTDRHSLPNVETAAEIWELGKPINKETEVPSLIKLLIQHYEKFSEVAERIQKEANKDEARVKQILIQDLSNFHSGIKTAISPDFLKTLDERLTKHPFTTKINKDGTREVFFLSLSRVLDDIELFMTRRIISTATNSDIDTLWQLRGEIAFVANCLEKNFG